MGRFTPAGPDDEETGGTLLAGGDKTKAARMFGVSGSQLYAKLETFGAES